MSQGTDEDWAGESEYGYVSRSHNFNAGPGVRLPLVNWKVLFLLGTLVAATACLAGECPCARKFFPRAMLTGHKGTVGSVVFQPGGKRLSTVGLNGSTMVWNMATLEGEPFPPVGAGLEHSVAFSPDGKFLATGNVMAPVAIHDLESSGARSLVDPSVGTVGAECLAFAPSGDVLAVGQQDGRITFWDVETREARSDLIAHDGFVASLAYSPDGTSLASSGGDCTVRLWELGSRRRRFELSGQPSRFVALAFSPDGRMLALADQRNPVVQLVDVATGMTRTALHGPNGAVLSLAISPDGATLAAADLHGGMTFWDLASLRIHPPQLTKQWVYALAFAPDGRTLVSGGVDGAILLWDWPLSSIGRGGRPSDH